MLQHSAETSASLSHQSQTNFILNSITHPSIGWSSTPQEKPASTASRFPRVYHNRQTIQHASGVNRDRTQCTRRVPSNLEFNRGGNRICKQILSSASGWSAGPSDGSND